MNFQTAFAKGQRGENVGLSTGIEKLDIAIGGIPRAASIGIAASEKVGKTTLADYIGVINPYLQAIADGTIDDLEIIYFSLEIERVEKEFKFACYFLNLEYGLNEFQFMGKTYKISPNYFLGREIHGKDPKTGKLIFVKVNKDHEEKLKAVYKKYIVPMFGVYDANGKQVQKGKITFISQPENPTGFYKYLMRFAETRGKFIHEEYDTLDANGNATKGKRIVGYTPNNKNERVLIVFDHIRKLRRERGFTMKENIDKFLEYTTEIRNLCKYTWLLIIHLNRGISNIERLKFFGDTIFPTSDEVKDTGLIKVIYYLWHKIKVYAKKCKNLLSI